MNNKYSLKEAVKAEEELVKAERLSHYKKCIKCDFMYDSKESTNDIGYCERCHEEVAESYSQAARNGRGSW